MSTRGKHPARSAEFIFLVASMPSMTGIRTSITTTSGPRLAVSSTASRPLAAASTTITLIVIGLGDDGRG
jgi:hypothetical protein